MKKLLLAITMLIGAVSSADTEMLKAQGLLQFKVEKANFSVGHVRNPGGAELTLNYDQAQVKLFVAELNQCPPNRMCAMVLRRPLMVELPILSVKTDSCGIRHVVAAQDSRPVDGILQQITILDPSQMTCKTFVAVKATATYKTAFYDRLNAKSVVEESKMELSLQPMALQSAEENLLETSMAPPILVKYVQNSGFSPRPTTRTLYVDVTGNVISSVQELRSGTATKTVLAQLSAAALKSLNKKIATVSVDVKLVDENANEPMCTDAPSSVVSVMVKGKEVAVHQYAGCHTFDIQTGYSSQLYSLMLGFSLLAD